MDKIIVYVDDADHAQQLLAPLAERMRTAPSHWVLVACAPRMTHRVSKWVSHSARESWRTKWADKLFAQITLAMSLPPAQLTTVLAKGPLHELTEQLQAEWQSQGGRMASVMDARKPRPANMHQPAPETSAAPPAFPPTAQAVATKPSPETPRPPEPPQHGPAPWPRVLGSVLAGCSTLWALSLD